MRQVLQDRRGSTVVRDVPLPAVSDADVLVRNLYSVISSGTERSRVALSRKSVLAKARERPDLVREVAARARREGVRATGIAIRHRLAQETAAGYSSAGVALEVGRAVAGISPGDLVACGGAGRANHAEVVSIPQTLCARVPEGVSPLAASFATLASIALHAIRLAEVELGERVAVIGCGLVGQIACRLLRAAGAEVFALDVEPARIEQARAGGADHALQASATAPVEVSRVTGGLGVDRALVTAAASTSEPLVLAAELLRDRGALVLVGDVPVEVDRSLLYEKEIALRVSRSYGPGRYDRRYEELGHDYPVGYVRWTEQRNMACVLDLVARGLLVLEDLADEIVPVEQAERAYARLIGPIAERPRGAIVLGYGTPDAPASPVLAAARQQRAAPRVGGSIRLGLVGPGSFASKTLVPAFVAAGATLELVGGGGGPSAAAAMRTLGFARVAEHADGVLCDPAVDAVAICTRHDSHAELARRALAAGKHVYCEKPLALTRPELDSVLAEAARSPGLLAVGFNRRFAPLLCELRDFLRAEPGPVTAVYRVSAGRLPADHWAHDLAQGGGRAIGEVCHFLDALAFLVGAPPVEVFAAGHGMPGVPLAAQDSLSATLSFADGSVATIVYSADGAAGLAKERVEAFAGDRTGVLDDFRALELLEGRKRVRRRGRRQDKGHAAAVGAFVAAAREALPGPVPLETVASSSEAAIALVESLQAGSPVRLSGPGQAYAVSAAG